MIKLYSKADGLLRYHEAWVDDEGIIEHWGRVGTKGRKRVHPLLPKPAESTQLRAVLADARAAGFASLRPGQHRTLVVQYKVRGFGSQADLRKRHELEDRLADLLGWHGLGNCDGGSIGGGTMEIACEVVDFELARKIIERDLRDTPFADYTRIYDERAE